MKPQFISFNCTVKDNLGKTVRTSVCGEALNSFEGDADHLNGLAAGMQDMKIGETRSLSLVAQQAYGHHNPRQIVFFPRTKFENHRSLACGEVVSIATKSGATNRYRIMQIHGDMLTLDGNHPLAGQDLVFEIQALDVRDATEIEMLDSGNKISKLNFHGLS